MRPNKKGRGWGGHFSPSFVSKEPFSALWDIIPTLSIFNLIKGFIPMPKKNGVVGGTLNPRLKCPLPSFKRLISVMFLGTLF